MEQKNLLIEQLHNHMQHMEVTTTDKINFNIDQIREGFEKQINMLEEKLKVSVQNQHLTNNMLSQQDKLVEKLQTQIKLS
jgi:hypothetical protein